MANFFNCVEEEYIAEKLRSLKLTDMITDHDKYPDGISKIMDLVSKRHPELIRPMHDFVKPFVSHSYLGVRIAATAMSGQHLRYIQVVSLNYFYTVFFNWFISRCTE